MTRRGGRHLLPGSRPVRRLVLLALCAVAASVTLASAQPGHAGPSCDWGSTAEEPIVNLAGATTAQVCGVEAVENEAYEMYAYTHGMTPGDARLDTEKPEIAGVIFSLLEQIAYARTNNPTTLTADESGAYDWLHGIVTTVRKTDAEDAIKEYNRWQVDPCDYLPPNPKVFSFRGSEDLACSPTEASLLQGPMPPSYEELIEMGQYDASQTLGLNDTIDGSKYQQLKDEQFFEMQATWSGLLLGAVPQLLRLTGPGQQLLQSAADLLPQRVIRQDMKNRIKELNETDETQEENLEDLQQEETLDEAGVEEDALIEEGAGDAIEDGVEAGIEVSEGLVDLGAGALTGPFIAAGFAAAVLIQEGIKVFDAAKIPQELQDNLAAADQEITDLIESSASGGGGATVQRDFEGKLLLPDPTIGTPGHVVDTPPDDGSRIKEEFADPSGTVRYTQINEVAKLATWPLGLDQGAYGVPQGDFTYFDGQIWHKLGSESDDALAGLSGWTPSGELHYFDWSGHPRLAIIDGDQFIDLSGPGSIDLGGMDSGDYCDTGSGTDCRVTSSIQALSFATGVNSSYTTDTLTNGGFTEERSFHPSDGTVTPPYQRVKLVLEPDVGAPAVINVLNRYGYTANDGDNASPPDGGLHTGDMVTLTDPLDHPFGASTTYTWKIESRCPYQAACPLDPAFNDDPTVTKTGQTVSYTWPAPGAYHITLSTLDQYGHSTTSSFDETVDGPTPSVKLTSSAGTTGPSVFGPVQNGNSETIAGCIASLVDAYADPHVTIDWGDGTTETQSGRAGGDSTLSFHYGTAPGCNQLWQFTATHTYDLPSTGVFQVQKAMHITVTDGLGDSTAISPATNVQFASAPSFSSANEATFVAGVAGSFVVSADGSPAPAISIVSGSLPSGIGFTKDAHGVYSISGAPSVSEGGTYPITFEATNSQGSPVDQTFTFEVDTAPAFTNSPTAAIPVGVATELDFAAAGTPTPTLYVSGATPGGMTFAGADGTGTATLTGTPTEQGTYHFSITATSAAGAAVQAFTLTVGTAPAFTSASTAGFVAGAGGAFTVTASGAPAPSLQVTSGSLPSGLFFSDNGDGTGSIWGTPSGTGSSTVTITATNSAGTATQSLTVTASSTGGPDVTVGATPNAVHVEDIDPGPQVADLATVAYSTAIANEVITVTSSDTSASLSESGALPDGVTFHDNGDGTATISGTPAVGGLFSLEVSAHPSSGPDGFTRLQLEIYGPPVLTSDPTAVFTAGVGGTFEVTAGGLLTARFGESGDLPPGLTFQDSGLGYATISGTPEASGVSTITVTSENLFNFGNPLSTTQTIEVDADPTFTSDPNGALGEGTSGSVTVRTGGYPAAAISELGALPPGVAFTDNGDGTATFSGTPTDTTQLSYPVVLQASNSISSATETYMLVVGPQPEITSAATADFTAGTAGSFTVTSDSAPPPTFTAANLPSGLSLTDNGDGTATISGTPAAGAGGLATIQVTATNEFGSVTQDVQTTVEEAPRFLGTAVGGDCGNTVVETSEQFLTANTIDWKLCASGYPAPTFSVSPALPRDVTLTSNGDGSATFSGAAGQGAGADYPLTLTMSNAAGSVTQTLTLVEDETAAMTSDATMQWVAGQQNTSTVSFSGRPTPTLRAGLLPSWMTFTDNGDGTATVAGTPPLSLLDSSNPLDRTIDIQVTPGQAGCQCGGLFNGGTPVSVTFDVAPLKFDDASPPDAEVGTPYSYSFTSSDQSATFSLAGGDLLPDGLALSTAGVLSGTPTTVGTWPFSVVATNADGSVTTDRILMNVHAEAHQLEISAFRLYGPAGPGDWYVSATNTTNVTIPLGAWKVDVFQPGLTKPVQETLPAENLAPNAAVTVAGPYFSLAHVDTDVVGPTRTANPGGFALVAPDGTVVDRAGEVGAPATAVAGAGTPVPSAAAVAGQGAFFRHVTDAGDLVDTDDNASDFTYTSLALVQTISFTSTAPASVTVGNTYTVSATGGPSTSPVRFSIDAASTSGACSISGAVVSFTGAGTCLVDANQAADLMYGPAATVSQSILVTVAPTATPPTTTATAAALPTASATVTPTVPKSIAVSSGAGTVLVTVPAGAVTAPANVTATLASPAPIGVAFSVGTAVVQLSVASLANGTPVTHFDEPVELDFPQPSAGFVPAYSPDGVTWTQIPQIATPPALPAGWPDGWFRDGAGVVHVLTRHATYFAILAPGSKVTPALRLHYGVTGSVNLDYRHTFVVHLQTSLPSAVTLTLQRGSKRLGSWHEKLTTDSRAVTIAVPRGARHVGTDTVALDATAGKESAHATAKLRLVARHRSAR